MTTLTTGARWSEYDTSNPINDIIATVRAARVRGIELTRMVIGYQTWLDLLQNGAIKAAIDTRYLPANANSVIVTDTSIRQFIEAHTGLTVIVYDKQYTDTARQTQSFYPQRGCATLLPASQLGSTWWGTTPEEADLMSGNVDADVSIVNTGVAVCTKKESLPVNIINWVSNIVLPSFENMDRVFNIKYTAD